MKCVDKFPEKTEQLNSFLLDILPSLQIVTTPSQALSDEEKISSI